ncbi:uncharacterized protein KY384_009002 [Bacidia gigantensis]|uniref:uncharacterized protein n=1 Tax=Bacidia gigantensis TaxID=2732470 RepID=UPI001D051C0A|nr:uncharacterized protein KY384_009002 [Bacidia gigantensis]KAG8525358.1 hypothetical protein KY384_009002 [Bacidia gigantensis]
MSSVWAVIKGANYGDQTKNQRDIQTQSVISVALGLIAFTSFCFLRPRWTSLYAARKRQKNAAQILPELPDTLFGWIPALYRITEEQVLASAGLDAYVFLSFFRMAIKFVAVTFFFQLVVMLPVHYTDTGDWGIPSPIKSNNETSNQTTSGTMLLRKGAEDDEPEASERMLWLYVFFVYLFSGLALYFIVTETKKIISVRQAYLASQTSITDRTIRLSGIPVELRSEELIKETVENLQIGKVESVLLCRDWTEVDKLMANRDNVLRNLEAAWTTYLEAPKQGRRKSLMPQRTNHDPDNETENARLLENTSPGQKDDSQPRPQARLWYGFMGLQSRKIDAIDYYEEKLRKIDEQVKTSRRKVFKPMPLAFVTLDSTATAQMAVQALMDPVPMQLVANVAPAPSDVVWENTYLSRSTRMSRAWLITLVIGVLTVFWSILLVPLAGLLSLQNIGRVSPSLEDWLNTHQTIRALVQTGLPTLLFSVLSVAVPYLYYWLSTLQGMVSQAEVEMSLISKNFFFTFFNLFVVFTVFGAASNAAGYIDRYLDEIKKNLKDTTLIAYILARSLKNLVLFYMNLIILQGLALFPFRLLEFGSVSLYPFYRLSSKTPRDYAELVAPPVFSYGFYLPQTILIYIICIVYSVLPGSWFVLFFGLLYFLLGAFIYKYQLLYAMDHRQHSTGRAWPIICNRIVLGLIVFQLAMAGILGLSTAFKRAALISPLLIFTIWFIVYYQRTYEPLMKFIAIRSLNHEPPFGIQPGQSRYETETAGRTVDESEETGLRYINPSLVLPLEEAWLPKQGADTGDEGGGTEGNGNRRDGRDQEV